MARLCLYLLFADLSDIRGLVSQQSAYAARERVYGGIVWAIMHLHRMSGPKKPFCPDGILLLVEDWLPKGFADVWTVFTYREFVSDGNLLDLSMRVAFDIYCRDLTLGNRPAPGEQERHLVVKILEHGGTRL